MAREKMETINEKIICAGFGGQGIMVMGKVIAEAAMLRRLNVTWLPAYGAEVRGGTAYAMVKVSKDLIANPVIDEADTGIIMNGPSFDRFSASVSRGGLLVVNTSLIPGDTRIKGVDVAAFPITDEAIKLGNVKVANVLAVGIYAARKKIFDKKTLEKVIEMMAGDRKELIPINIAALKRGAELAEK